VQRSYPGTRTEGNPAEREVTDMDWPVSQAFQALKRKGLLPKEK